MTAVEPFGPGDAAALAAAERLAFAGSSWSAAAYAAELARPHAKVFGIREGGRIAAAACLWLLPPEAELLRIFSIPGARRRGLARALLGRAADLAARSGCRTIHLEVDARNAPARALYAAAGFREVGRRPGYYPGPGGDAVLLERALPARPLDAARGVS